MVKSGCIFRCSYCDNHATAGREFRFRKTAEILADLRTLARRGQRVVFLSDPCFNYPLDRAKTLLQAMIDARLRIRFCTTVKPIPGHFDPEFFSLYRRAGGIFAMLGCESFSPAMLAGYQVPFGLADIERWGSMAGEAGLPFAVELLFGGPGETYDTVNESLAFLPRLPFALFLYGIGIRILPGTAVAATAIAEGLVTTEADLFQPVFYVSKSIDVQRTRKLAAQAKSRYGYRQLRLLPMVAKNLAKKFLGI